MHLTGVVLAGGKSSRMGQDKGLMLLNGKPMVTWVLEALSQVTEDIIIIANSPDYQQFGHKVYADDFPERGPLGGICTALRRTSSEQLLVLSCDMPLVNRGLLEYLISFSNSLQATTTIEEDFPNPFSGIYPKSLLPTMLTALKNKELSLVRILQKEGFTGVSLDEKMPFYHSMLLHNVNSPEALAKASAFMSSHT